MIYLGELCLVLIDTPTEIYRLLSHSFTQEWLCRFHTFFEALFSSCIIFYHLLGKKAYPMIYSGNNIEKYLRNNRSHKNSTKVFHMLYYMIRFFNHTCIFYIYLPV